MADAPARARMTPPCRVEDDRNEKQSTWQNFQTTFSKKKVCCCCSADVSAVLTRLMTGKAQGLSVGQAAEGQHLSNGGGGGFTRGCDKQWARRDSHSSPQETQTLINSVN